MFRNPIINPLFKKLKFPPRYIDAPSPYVGQSYPSYVSFHVQALFVVPFRLASVACILQLS